MLKKLIKDIFSQKGIYLLLLVGILNQLIFVFIPYLSKYYIDFIQNKDLNASFWNLIYLGVGMLIINLFLGVFKDYYKEGFIKRYENSLTIYYFRKFFSLDYEYRNSEGTGKTITKINRGIDSQVSLLNTTYNVIVILLVRVIVIGSIIFSLYKPIIGVLFFTVIILIFVNKYLSKRVKTLTDEEQVISEKVGRQTNKMVMESNLINVGNKQKYEINVLSNIVANFPKLKQKIYLNNSSLYIFLDIIFNLIELLSYAFLGILVVKSQMTLGEMTMIILYFGWMWWPIQIVVSNISEYRNQISKYEALENFVNQENKIKDGNKKFEIKSGLINFENIDFGYNEEKGIFHNFNLQINGGKTTALVGHSGSGKSTIIKLILRNYIVNSGKIIIDGQDIADLEIKTLYENIGYLSQEPAVFDGSIRENLMYGVNNVENGFKPFPTEIDNLLWEALKKVDLYDLIKETKNGLETEVGEKGLKLSGGERQRIALARIFLSNPKILILDEPTSALDSISENKVTQIITQMMKDKTVIVIAHRLQTVMNADKIIVLEKGKIIETGNHTELLQKAGIYASLVDLQRGVINE